MKAKRLCAVAIVLCMVLWMMPVGVFATEETSDECICLTFCSEKAVNENCGVCSKDIKQCVKAKQRTAASTEVSTEEEKTSAVTTEKQEVTTKMTTEKQEVTTKMATEKQEVTTKAVTEKQEVKTKATTEKAEDVIAKGDGDDLDDTKIDVNETNFPDEAFRNWIIENISGADDKVLTDQELEAVKSIDVSGQGIKSLTGIKQFKYLETLDCSNNSLKTLDLSEMTSLKTVNANGQDGGTAIVVEEENGWKLDMKKVVGENSLKNVKFADGSLPEGSKYEASVVVFSGESVPDKVTYNYSTGTDTDMKVTLSLEKKALPKPEPTYTVTLDGKGFDFGKKCVGIKADKQSIKIENKSDESIKFEAASTSENSNYDIDTTEGTIQAKSTVTVKVGPKEGLKAGEYKENFNIKINGKEAETFSASFQVVEHDKNITWSSDSEKHWHECKICGAKFDESIHTFVWKVDQQPTSTKEGSGHNECNVCRYKRSSVIIAATGTISSTSRTVSTVRTTTATAKAGLLSKIIPTTGDNSHVVLWLGVLVICGVTILGALGRYLGKRK